MILMPEHELVNWVLKYSIPRDGYSDWKQEVLDQITELYNYKLRFHIAERDLSSLRKERTND